LGNQRFSNGSNPNNSLLGKMRNQYEYEQFHFNSQNDEFVLNNAMNGPPNYLNGKMSLPLNQNSFHLQQILGGIHSNSNSKSNTRSSFYSNANRNDRSENQQMVSNSVRELEEFTENILRNHEKIDEECYKQLRGMFVKIIMIQNGSRMLQKCLKKTNKDILTLMLDEILDKIKDLTTDSYANYFCQKFFSCLKNSDRLRFLDQVAKNIIELSKSAIGTYPIQAFIEQLSTNDEKTIIIESIREELLDLCYVIYIFL
jgi:hypothetical protein